MTNGLNAPQRARYADHSLAVYLAPLIEGRRVAVVGPSSGDVAKRLRSLGAATVVAFGGTGEGVAVRALVPGAIESFHGKVDCVVVPDAATVDLPRILDEARRALGSQGIVAVGTRPPEAPSPMEPAAGNGPGYYDLQDALLARWSTVAMVGRGPFVGYAYAAIEGGEGGVALDTRIIPDEPVPAEAYIALASDSPLPVDAIALVQVPAGEVISGRASEQPSGVGERVTELEAEVHRRDARVKELESAAADRWVKIQRLEHELKSQEEEGRKARDRSVKLTRELDDERKLRQRIELDAQMVRRAPELPRGVDPEDLKRAQDRVAQLERELTTVRQEAEASGKRVVDLEREIDETQATEAALREQLDLAERARDAARGELGRAQPEPVAKPASVPPRAIEQLEAERAATAEIQADHARLERELYARAAEVIALREQVSARDAAVRELTYSLDSLHRGEAATQAQRDRERAAELSALNAALAAEAHEIVQQNELLHERLGHLEQELANRESAGPVSAAVPPPDAATEALEKRAAEEKRRGDECAEALRLAEERAVRSDSELRSVREEIASERAAREALSQQLRAAQQEIQQYRAERSSIPPVDPRIVELESRLADAEGNLASERARRAEVEAQLRDAGSSHDENDRRAAETQSQLEAEWSRSAELTQRAAAARADAERAHAAVAEAQSALAEERTRSAEITRQLGDARTDLSRQYALIASMEDRTSQTVQELEGARAGYNRRVRELEREVEGLLQALEVSGAHSSDEGETLESVLREVDTSRAERRGVELRLLDAEAALLALSEARARASSPDAGVALDATVLALPSDLKSRMDAIPGDLLAPTPTDTEPGIRNEQLLADLAETAAKLAETEEILADIRQVMSASDHRIAELTRSLEAARAEIDTLQQRDTAQEAPRESVESMRREAGERELLVRSLVAQLEDRDLRLRSMERRLIEEVERARRTESEIWEVELRARDQRIAALGREVERVRSDRSETPPAAESNGGAHDVEALHAEIAGRDRELSNLRAALESVRAGLSSILVDGRGAVVAHDLVTILRQIEEPEA